MKNTVICRVKGDRPMRKLCHALFCSMAVEAGGVPYTEDGGTTYSISTNQRLSRNRHKQVHDFARGVLIGMIMAGLMKHSDYEMALRPE